MKKYWTLLVLICAFSAVELKAQEVDSIYVHLYTDSLRTGTFNYINIDGKMSDGTWLPLDTNHLKFSSDAGQFHGNNLWLDEECKVEKVNITVKLKARPSLNKHFAIYIKKGEDEELPTEQEILNRMRKRN